MKKIKFTIPSTSTISEQPISYEGFLVNDYSHEPNGLEWVDVEVKLDWRTTKIFNVKKEWIHDRGSQA